MTVYEEFLRYAQRELLPYVQPYVQLLMTLVSCTLAFALALGCSHKGLVARGWLIAFTAIVLVAWPGSQVLLLIARHSADGNGYLIYKWFGVLQLLGLFGPACFGLFLFSNWSRSRMKLDVGDLLFSFAGRIPRSAFWISVCILFPLGTLVGFAPFTSGVVGYPKRIVWTVFALWGVFGTWISLAVYAKRWHDCGRSGWMTLISLVPFIGPFWLFGYLGFVRGTAGSNQYGDDPLNTDGLTSKALTSPGTSRSSRPLFKEPEGSVDDSIG